MVRSLFCQLVFSNLMLALVLLGMRYGARGTAEVADGLLGGGAAQSNQVSQRASAFYLWFALAVLWTTGVTAVQLLLGVYPGEYLGFWRLLRLAGWLPGLITGVRLLTATLAAREAATPPAPDGRP